MTSDVPRTPRNKRLEPPSGLSYKFQRLRERIRQAIVRGELAGKLPGERSLAKRFHCNAKTLSKALTDLASEGVLDRSIGRGTFIKGSAPRADQGRWLLLCDREQASAELAAALGAANADAEMITEADQIRPSFLNQFGAVVVLSSGVSEEFLRDLSLRNMPVVLVNREPGTFSHHAVLLDAGLAGARLGRELLLQGHRRIGVVERRGRTALVQSIRQTAARYTSEAIVEICEVDEIAALIDNRFTAIIAGSASLAAKVKSHLSSRGIAIPAEISLAAIGCAPMPAPCSGYFASPRQIAESVAEILRNRQPARPAVLWLAGEWHDAGTLAPGGMGLAELSQIQLRTGPVV